MSLTARFRWKWREILPKVCEPRLYRGSRALVGSDRCLDFPNDFYPPGEIRDRSWKRWKLRKVVVLSIWPSARSFSAFGLARGLPRARELHLFQSACWLLVAGDDGIGPYVIDVCRRRVEERGGDTSLSLHLAPLSLHLAPLTSLLHQQDPLATQPWMLLPFSSLWNLFWFVQGSFRADVDSIAKDGDSILPMLTDHWSKQVEDVGEVEHRRYNLPYPDEKGPYACSGTLPLLMDYSADLLPGLSAGIVTPFPYQGPTTRRHLPVLSLYVSSCLVEGIARAWEHSSYILFIGGFHAGRERYTLRGLILVHSLCAGLRLGSFIIV